LSKGTAWISAGALAICAPAAPAQPNGPVALPQAQAVPNEFPAAGSAEPRVSYRIVPNDVLNLQVFDEPSLSNDELQVDASGFIQMPLVGEVLVGGRTPSDVAGEIEKRLRQRYIVDPQVVLSIKKAAPRMFSVEGQVNKPGVYEVDGNTTLLSALAKAESPTRVARLKDIVVFRNGEGKRFAARFDLTQIRTGDAPDPQIVNGDVIVVGFARGKGLWRDLVQVAPLFNVFYLFR
jgi:polysaccharide export outer membrane protein